MAKIGLSEGFTLIPEGIYVFKVVEVNYKEAFGKLEVTLETAAGQKHVERFSLLSSNGEANQGGLNAFSYFAKTVLNDFSLQEIDHEDLVGHYIRCTVEHEQVESTKKPGKYNTFARLTDKEPAEGFDEPVKGNDTTTPVKTSQASAQNVTEGSKKFNLNSILG